MLTGRDPFATLLLTLVGPLIRFGVAVGQAQPVFARAPGWGFAGAAVGAFERAVFRAAPLRVAWFVAGAAGGREGAMAVP
jgi:hypothetical protein